MFLFVRGDLIDGWLGLESWCQPGRIGSPWMHTHMLIDDII
jgi:hypothetical protein